MGAPAYSSHRLCSAQTAAFTLITRWWTGRAQCINQDAAARLVEQPGSFFSLPVASSRLKHLRWKMAFSWWLRSSSCRSPALLWGWQGLVEQLEAITSRTAPPWAAGPRESEPEAVGLRVPYMAPSAAGSGARQDLDSLSKAGTVVINS